MKIIVLTLLLAGCGSLNGPRHENHQASELVKPCCCAGTEHCGTDPATGETCCSPDRCSCKQVTSR